MHTKEDFNGGHNAPIPLSNLQRMYII
jgi:hypothetical protein